MKKDDIVFALYKDMATGNKNEFRKKVKRFADSINVSDMFIKINNYQVERYGGSLSNYDEKKTRHACLKQAAHARQRKYEKTRGRIWK